MIYSVFDWNSGLYQYLEGPGEGLGVRPVGKEVNDPQGKGYKLEELLPTVPAGARPMGRGPTPKGRIAMLTPQLRNELAATGSSGDEAVRQLTGLGAADDVSWWPTFSTCEEAYPPERPPEPPPPTAVANYGFGAATTPQGAAPVTGNPLVDSPWTTLALWAGAVYGLYWLATVAGRYVAERR